MTYILSSIFLILLFFGGLGDTYLTNWDEAWYADISRNVLQTGNLFTLYFNSQPFFDKPPLYMWLSALVMSIFSVNEFSARFISALAGLGSVMLVFLITKNLFNKTSAIFASFILISCVGFLYRARTGNLDTLVAFFILLSIFSLYQKKYSLLFISVVGGFLTKGILIFIFPGLFFIYSLVKDKRIPIKFIFSILGSIVLCLGWFGISYLINGQVFIDQFLANQLGKINNQRQYFWDNFSFEYVNYLKSGLKLWFVLIIPAILYFGWRFKNNNKIILLIFFIIFFGILSFAQNKSNWFLVPLFPLIAIFIGVFLDKIFLLFKRKGIIVFFMVGVIVVFQLIFYRNLYILENVAKDEVNVAIQAKKISQKNENLFLTDSFYPTNIFYSERKTYAMFGDINREDTWWIKDKRDWSRVLSQPSLVIGSTNEIDNLKKDFPSKNFQLIYKSGDRNLVKVY